MSENEKRLFSLIILKGFREKIVKSRAVKIWKTALNARDYKEISLKVGYLSAFKTDRNYPLIWEDQNARIDARSKIQRELNLFANCDFCLSFAFEEKEKGKNDKVGILQPLKLQYLKIKPRVRAQPEFFNYVYNANYRKRRAKFEEVIIPRIEDFKPEKGFFYKFVYKNPFNGKIRVKYIKTHHKRKRVTPYMNVTRGKFGDLNSPYILQRLEKINKVSYEKTILYENRLKPKYPEISTHTVKTHNKPVTYTRIIDYEALMYYYRKMSRKYRLQLLNSIENKSLPVAPKLRRIYEKCVKKVKAKPTISLYAR